MMQPAKRAMLSAVLMNAQFTHANVSPLQVDFGMLPI
jgi:hypothetical protein